MYAHQEPHGLGVYFECKQPKDDTLGRLKEQRRIFNGIEEVISDKYSLALFYEKELSPIEINMLRDQIVNSFRDDNDIYENRNIVDDISLGVKLCISGIPDNIEKNSVIELSGIPNFSDKKGYTNANGMNRYGKNIIFYKLASMNSIDGQLRNSCNKVPDCTPYVVCIDNSGSRFGFDECSEHIAKHFRMGDYPSFSGVLMVEHGLQYDSCCGRYLAQMRYIENQNAIFPLPFLKHFFYPSLTVDVNSRYTSV